MLTGILISATGIVQSGLLSYEGFDYTAGEALTNGTTGINGGTGWNSPWFRDYSGGNIRYITNGIASVGTATFSGQTVSPYTPIGQTFDADANSERGIREWAASTGDSNSFSAGTSGSADEMWISLLVNKGPNSGDFLAVNLFGGDQSSTANLALKFGQSGQYVTLENGNIINRNFSAVSVDTDYFVLLKLSSDVNSRDVRVQSAAYDDVTNVPSVEGGIAWDLDGTHTFVSDINLNAIGLQGSITSGGNVLADELRIGDGFSDIAVIPEPSSLSLLGMALGTLVLFWRKFRS